MLRLTLKQAAGGPVSSLSSCLLFCLALPGPFPLQLTAAIKFTPAPAGSRKFKLQPSRHYWRKTVLLKTYWLSTVAAESSSSCFLFAQLGLKTVWVVAFSGFWWRASLRASTWSSTKGKRTQVTRKLTERDDGTNASEAQASHLDLYSIGASRSTNRSSQFLEDTLPRAEGAVRKVEV